MAQLRQGQSEFEKSQTTVVVVGPEKADAFTAYWNENDLPFIGLPDPAHTILKLYGQEVKLFRLGRMPAQALVDKRGIVRFAYYGHDMSDIPTIQDTLEAIASISDPEDSDRDRKEGT